LDVFFFDSQLSMADDFAALSRSCLFQWLPANSSHGQLVTGQLVTHASCHKVNSSQAST